MKKEVGLLLYIFDKGCAYMSTWREVLEGQTAAGRAKRGELRKRGPDVRGFGGPPHGNFQNPVLQMVQSELFLGYICQYQ